MDFMSNLPLLILINPFSSTGCREYPLVHYAAGHALRDGVPDRGGGGGGVALLHPQMLVLTYSHAVRFTIAQRLLTAAALAARPVRWVHPGNNQCRPLPMCSP